MKISKAFKATLGIIGFVVSALWILTFIAVAIAFSSTYSGILGSSILGLTSGGVYIFLHGWYWFTIAIIGALVARWGFRLIGRWERINGKEELELNKDKKV